MRQTVGDVEKVKMLIFPHKSENCEAKRALKRVASCFLNFKQGHTGAILNEYESQNLSY